MNEVLLKLYLNAAHCFLELAEVKKVLTYARKVLVDTLCFCQKIWRKTYAHLIYLCNGWLNGLRQSIPLRVWKIIELLLVMSYCCLFHDWGLFVAFSVTEERLFIRRIVLSFLSKVEVAFPWADCSFRSSQQLMLLKYILKLSLIVRYIVPNKKNILCPLVDTNSFPFGKKFLIYY